MGILPVKRSEMMDFRFTTLSLRKESAPAHETSYAGRIPYFRISKRVNFKRNSPSILMERSPKTKKPPSVHAVQYEV